MNSCKHYNRHVWLERGDCDAGINVRQLVGSDDTGWIKRTPCFKKDCSSIVCDKYEDYTEKELKDKVDWLEDIVKKMQIASPIIKKLKYDNPDGGIGVIKCPVCSGDLHYSVAACNNHVHGRCETDDCLNWME